MNYICNGDTPHFGCSEITQIYHLAEEKTTECLQTTAKKLFPGLDPIMYENLILQKGNGRAFEHNGECTLPKWTIVAWPESFGVMEDDMIYPFCDPKYYRRHTK